MPNRRSASKEGGPTPRSGPNLALAAAKGLFANGQSTERVVQVAQALAVPKLGSHLYLRWGELSLISDSGARSLPSVVEAEPTGVDMTRVAAIMRVAEQASEGRLPADKVRAEMDAASRTPPAPTWLFAIAAAAGALSLSIIFGLQHPLAGFLILLSAGIGAVVRRTVARATFNPFAQPFAAALIAGLVGGAAERLQLSSALRLIAVCPCMILVPGPHILNGGLDLLRGRIHLGAARLIFAALIITAICTGLILGLGFVGVTLPVEPVGRSAPFLEDVLAAGVAVAAYSVFFNTPARMLPWPIAVGAFAHALRWLVITYLGFGVAGAALVACTTVGVILTPIADRLRVPFAAVGFAAVVSMMPGVFLFRMASGLVAVEGGAGSIALSGAVSDGVTAVTITLAMIIGLLVPKLIIDGIMNPKISGALKWN